MKLINISHKTRVATAKASPELLATVCHATFISRKQREEGVKGGKKKLGQRERNPILFAAVHQELLLIVDTKPWPQQEEIFCVLSAVLGCLASSKVVAINLLKLSSSPCQ